MPHLKQPKFTIQIEKVENGYITTDESPNKLVYKLDEYEKMVNDMVGLLNQTFNKK